MLCFVVLAVFQPRLPASSWEGQSLLFTLTQEGCNALCALFPALSCEGCTLLHQSEAHLPFFHQLAHSLQYLRRWPQERSRFSASLLSPLESALGHPAKDGHPEEPQLATKGLPLAPLRSAHPETAFAKSFRIRTYEKTGGGGTL